MLSSGHRAHLQDLQCLMMEQEDSILGCGPDRDDLAAAIREIEGLTIQFTAAEVSLYTQVFTAAACSEVALKTGAKRTRLGVGQPSSVNRLCFDRFLPKAGMQEEDLDKIWGLSDLLGEGELGKEQFFVALRLAAHLQTGRQPTPEMSVEPPACLPEFEKEQLIDLLDLGFDSVVNGGTTELYGELADQSIQAESCDVPHVFTAWELEFYDQIWRTANIGNSSMDISTFKRFLPQSGLDLRVLDSIWVLSDINGAGHLDRDGFFRALRLAAHAQAGSEPSLRLALVLPPALPRKSSSQLALVSSVGRPTDASRDGAPESNSTAMIVDTLHVPDMNDFSVRFSAAELEFYHRIAVHTAAFATCTAASQDCMRPGAGLSRSDFDRFLPRGGNLPFSSMGDSIHMELIDDDTAACIWEFADTLGDGCLDLEGFFVALRLASHAMTGLQPSFELVDLQPSVLPKYSRSQVIEDPSLADLSK